MRSGFGADGRCCWVGGAVTAGLVDISEPFTGNFAASRVISLQSRGCLILSAPASVLSLLKLVAGKIIQGIERKDHATLSAFHGLGSVGQPGNSAAKNASHALHTMYRACRSKERLAYCTRTDNGGRGSRSTDSLEILYYFFFVLFSPHQPHCSTLLAIFKG